MPGHLIFIWGQMRGCLEGHSLCSYLNTAAGQGLSQALETSLFLVGLGGRDGGRTEAWAPSPSAPLLPSI